MGLSIVYIIALPSGTHNSCPSPMPCSVWPKIPFTCSVAKAHYWVAGETVSFMASLGHSLSQMFQSICQACPGFLRKLLLSLINSLTTCSSQLGKSARCGYCSTSLGVRLVFTNTVAHAFAHSMTFDRDILKHAVFFFCSSSSHRASDHTSPSSIARGSGRMGSMFRPRHLWLLPAT